MENSEMENNDGIVPVEGREMENNNVIIQVEGAEGHELGHVLYGVMCPTCSPPWIECVVLGFQQYMVVLLTTVLIMGALVDRSGGGYREKEHIIQTCMFVGGVNTLIQLYLGTRLPVVMDISSTYRLAIVSMIMSRADINVDPNERFLSTIRATQGAQLIASLLPIIVGFLGIWEKLAKFLSPLSAVPLTTLVGLGLYPYAFQEATNCIEIGVPTFLSIFLALILSRNFPSARNFLDRYATLITIVVLGLYSHIFTVAGVFNATTNGKCRTDQFGLVKTASWIKIPYPFQWGKPTVRAGEMFAVMMTSFVVLIESTGTYIAVARFAGATPISASVLSRGVGWQGVGLFINGLFGTILGCGPSNANVGLMAITRVGSRRVTHITVGLMIFFSIIGKVGAFLGSIPTPIVGALCCVLYGCQASAGLGILQYCKINSFRSMLILGIPFSMGVYVPNYFNQYFRDNNQYPIFTSSNAFNDMVNVIFLSVASVAVTLAILMDTLFDYGSNEARRESVHLLSL